MIFKFFNNLKFFISKINVYLKYKKKSIPLAFHWFFFGQDISNFTYEIENYNELIHTCHTITSVPFEELQKILEEINFNNEEFKKFFSEDFYKKYEKKNIFGRRLVWYILVRALKPELVIESGIDRGLGSCLLIYAQYKNSCETKENFEYIGTDIVKKNQFCFNLKNNKFNKFKFIFDDTLNFLSTFNDKKKIIYISDAEHNFDFELKEFNEIKKNLATNSLLISDNNSGSLSQFSITNKKKLTYFNEKSKNFWYKGAVTSVSYFY